MFIMKIIIIKSENNFVLNFVYIVIVLDDNNYKNRLLILITFFM